MWLCSSGVLLDSRAHGFVIFFWIRELLGCYLLLDFRGCTAHSILLSWFLRLFLPSQLFDRSRIRGVLSGSTGKIVLSTVRHLAQLARLPPIFFSSTGRAFLNTVRHLAQLARLPSSFLSSLTLRQLGGRGREFRRGRSTQLDMKGLVSIVRSIRLLFAGTRYWVLEYLLADASLTVAITSPSPWYGSLVRIRWQWRVARRLLSGYFSERLRLSLVSLPRLFTAVCFNGSSLTGRQRGFVRSLRRTQSTPFELC